MGIYRCMRVGSCVRFDVPVICGYRGLDHVNSWTQFLFSVGMTEPTDRKIDEL